MKRYYIELLSHPLNHRLVLSSYYHDSTLWTSWNKHIINDNKVYLRFKFIRGTSNEFQMIIIVNFPKFQLNFRDFSHFQVLQKCFSSNMSTVTTLVWKFKFLENFLLDYASSIWLNNRLASFIEKNLCIKTVLQFLGIMSKCIPRKFKCLFVERLLALFIHRFIARGCIWKCYVLHIERILYRC